MKPNIVAPSVGGAAGTKEKPKVDGIVSNSENEEQEDSEDDASSTGSSERNKISKKNIISDSLAVGGQKRVASLNAQAKVQCLYENESRSAHELGLFKVQPNKQEVDYGEGDNVEDDENSEDEGDDLDKDDKGGGGGEKETGSALKRKAAQQRSLRNAPGLRAVGKHWESSEEFSDEESSDSGSSYQAEKVSAIIFSMFLEAGDTVIEGDEELKLKGKILNINI